MERRKGVRYDVAVPALFSWRSKNSRHLHGAGFTRDISTTSVYIASQTKCPPVNAEISIEVLLPADFRLLLNVEGVVKRRSKSAEGMGFAIQGNVLVHGVTG